MNYLKQIKILKDLVYATKELNGEFQEGWEETIEEGEEMIKHLQYLNDMNNGLYVTDKPEVLTEEQKKVFWQL